MSDTSIFYLKPVVYITYMYIIIIYNIYTYFYQYLEQYLIPGISDELSEY